MIRLAYVFYGANFHCSSIEVHLTLCTVNVIIILLQVFLCVDVDNDRRLAIKEVWIDPNFSNETKKVQIHLVYIYT